MNHELIIQTENIGKTYQMGTNSVQALKGVNLNLKRGAFAALVGPSGGGKSTLLNICGLIDSCDEGQLLFNGENLTHSCDKKLTQIRREKVGFVFQGFNLVPVMSIFDNIEYPLILADTPKKERQKRVNEMIAFVGLEGLSSHLPDQISGGQKQRVAIARALIKKPLLVIADEPTANLDTSTAKSVIDLMHGMCESEKSTFIIATHDQRMASRCDTQLELVDGVLQ